MAVQLFRKFPVTEVLSIQLSKSMFSFRGKFQQQMLRTRRETRQQKNCLEGLEARQLP